MSEPFIGEIRSFGFNFAPIGWLQCNGQLLAIAQFDTLFAILGTTYGGNGTTNFALPNLQGQSPMHWGTSPGLNTQIGQVMGQSNVTLTLSQMPAHVHAVMVAVAGVKEERTPAPSSASFLSSSQPPNRAYVAAPTSFNAPFSPKAIGVTGGSQPHENMQPYLVLNFCIATEGIFPQRG
jgi:microcystin-dependent protein